MNAKTLLRFLLTASLLGAGRPVEAFSTKITKIHAAKNTTYAFESGFGSALALSDRWLLAGESSNDDFANNGGVVHVFHPVTGAHVRRLVADDIPASRFFGASVALWGNIAVVGAPLDSEVAASSGAVYVFDLTTGKQLRKLKAADASTTSLLGWSVSISGGLVLVGAWRDDAVAANSGSAYVFDVHSGAQMQKLTAGDGGIDHYLGYEVALCGNLAVVGALQADGAVATTGAVYVFDAASGAQIHKLEAGDGQTDDNFGSALAVDGTLVLVGAQGNDGLAANAGAAYLFNAANGKELTKVVNTPYGGTNEYFGSMVAINEGVAIVGALGTMTSRGAAYRIDLRNGQIIDQILAPDGEASDLFSVAAAIHGNRMVIGAYGDSDKAPVTGATYIYHSIPGTLPLTSLARSGSFAAGALGTEFSVFKNASINRGGAVMFDASLRGAGSNGGRDQGGWSTLGTEDSLGLLLKSRDLLDSLGPDFGGTRMSGVLAHAVNQSKYGVLRMSLSGTGVTAKNNQAVLCDNGLDLKPVVRTGIPQILLGNGEISVLRDVVQNRGVVTPLLAIGHQLRQQVGIASAKDDSGVIFAHADGGTVFDAEARENAAAPGGGAFGQFPGRVAICNEAGVFPSLRVDVGLPKQAIFKRVPGGLSSNVAEAGAPAPGAGAATFKAFVSEGVNFNEDAIFRATLAGPAVTPQNNEGLWHQATGLVARKGDQVPGEPAGVVWSRFLGYWPVADNGLVIHAQVRGPGVNASNAIGIWARLEDGSLLPLMRQGVPVHATDGAKVRAIQRVDVEPLGGAYVVLASLTGAAARNQALFAGSLSLGDPVLTKGARLPQMKLRKGQRFQGTGGGIQFITSMLMSPTTDAGGSGAKGLGQAINGSGQVALRVTLDNRSTEIIRYQDVSFGP